MSNVTLQSVSGKIGNVCPNKENGWCQRSTTPRTEAQCKDNIPWKMYGEASPKEVCQFISSVCLIVVQKLSVTLLVQGSTD